MNNKIMQDLNDLYYFVQVVNHSGFAPAGRALNMPKSKLSRRIALLEERLGVRLIQRTTRRFTVTEVGQRYYEHCKAMLVEADAAQEAIDTLRAEPRGIIRMSCPIAMLHTSVSLMANDFMKQFPHIMLQIEATNRRVDLVAEGIDLAIRVRPPPLQNSDLVMRVLAERAHCLVTNPALLAEFGAPALPADLHAFPSLGMELNRPTQQWHLFGEDNAQVTLHHTPRFVSNDMIALRDAAIAGVGIVQLPIMMMQNELKSGALINVLPNWAPRAEIVHVVFPSRRGLLPSVRALIDFLAMRFATLNEV